MSFVEQRTLIVPRVLLGKAALISSYERPLFFISTNLALSSGIHLALVRCRGVRVEAIEEITLRGAIGVISTSPSSCILTSRLKSSDKHDSLNSRLYVILRPILVLLTKP